MSKARNETVTSETQELIKRLDWYHSLRLPGGELIEGLISEEQLKWRIAQFPIPEDLTGKRVLDIGAWDGWFTFEMERRGAQVVAIDLVDDTKFRTAHRMMNSRAEYYVEDITYLTPEKYGTFDIVLFFGVLYHLKHPMLALERVCELSTDLVCVESYVSDESLDGPVTLEFYESTELSGQFDNWCGPTLSCLMAMCRTAGFAEVNFHSVADYRAHVSCQRLWQNTQIRGAQSADTTAPKLICAENTVWGNHSFDAQRDDYISAWIEVDASVPELTLDLIFPQVGSFGVRPAGVRRFGEGGWQVTFKLPLGLEPGWHDLSIAITGREAGNRLPIPVGLPSPPYPALESNAIEIESVTDGKSWERNIVHAGKESCVSAWVRNLPEEVSADELFFLLAGTLHPVSFLSGPGELRQINAILPRRIPLGETQVRILCRQTASEPQAVEIVPASVESSGPAASL